MDVWDVADMNEVQRSQVRPSMAAAITQGQRAIALKKCPCH